MPSANNTKRIRDAAGLDVQSHLRQTIPSTEPLIIELSTATHLSEESPPNKKRTIVHPEVPGDDVVLVQHVLCVRCDQLFTLQGDTNRQETCVSPDPHELYMTG